MYWGAADMETSLDWNIFPLFCKFRIIIAVTVKLKRLQGLFGYKLENVLVIYDVIIPLQYDVHIHIKLQVNLCASLINTCSMGE